jgi:hypothetical protein
VALFAHAAINLPSEDSDILIVRAGPKLELLAKNGLAQLLMDTPAISGRMMFVRAERDLFAIGRRGMYQQHHHSRAFRERPRAALSCRLAAQRLLQSTL